MAEKDQEKKPEVSEKENVTAEKTVDQDTAKKEPEEKQSSEETEKKLSDLQKKYDELEDKYLRAEAEMQNMTKRFKKNSSSCSNMKDKTLFERFCRSSTT